MSARKKKRNRQRLTVEQLELRRLMAADLGCLQNPFDSMDVNDDGSVSAMDAMAVINRLNNPTGTGQNNEFVDVNGDQASSALDALLIIDELNRGGVRRSGPKQPGQGDSTPPDRPQQSPIIDDDIRSIDGTDNNIDNPEWGSTGEDLLRNSDPAYEDGVSAPSGADRPSAREISNVMASQSEGLLNQRGLTAMAYAFGQFLDHDIDLTPGGNPSEPFYISVPTGDAYFDPTGSGEAIIPMTRSLYDTDTGTDATNPRQQINNITSFIDGSQVYGSDAERAAALRSFEGGRMLVTDENLLPSNTDLLPNDNDAHVTSANNLFLAGDVRANENIELSSLQTLFVREHNRLADAIAARDSSLTDEQIYQQARRIVIGELQSITFNEFLPSLLGADAIQPFQGYDPSVNPGIATEFSTAAYRIGHTMLGNDVEFLDNDGNEIFEAVALREAFFNPDLLRETGIDSILNYLAEDTSQEVNSQLVDEVRNFLFGPPGAGGFDLASLNIQRGRDHGLADYNSVRVAYGLPAVNSFAEVSSNPDVQSKLESLYGSVDNIDLWVGGLAEDHVPGTSVGETFRTIMVEQFERLRDGDRFWYQNTMSGSELRTIESTTLADIIRRNSEADPENDNVFFNSSTLVADGNSGRMSDWVITGRDGEVTIHDRDDRSNADSMPADEVNRVVLTGSDRAPDRVMIDLNSDTVTPNMEVDGGAGRGDLLVINLSDQTASVSVSDRVIMVDGQEIDYSQFEMVVLQPNNDSTDISIADGLDTQFVVRQAKPQPPQGRPPSGQPPQGGMPNSGGNNTGGQNQGGSNQNNNPPRIGGANGGTTSGANGNEANNPGGANPSGRTDPNRRSTSSLANSGSTSLDLGMSEFQVNVDAVFGQLNDSL